MGTSSWPCVSHRGYGFSRGGPEKLVRSRKGCLRAVSTDVCIGPHHSSTNLRNLGETSSGSHGVGAISACPISYGFPNSSVSFASGKSFFISSRDFSESTTRLAIYPTPIPNTPAIASFQPKRYFALHAGNRRREDRLLLKRRRHFREKACLWSPNERLNRKAEALKVLDWAINLCVHERDISHADRQICEEVEKPSWMTTHAASLPSPAERSGADTLCGGSPYSLVKP
jgi:hypothetical protein